MKRSFDLMEERGRERERGGGERERYSGRPERSDRTTRERGIVKDQSEVTEQRERERE